MLVVSFRIAAPETGAPFTSGWPVLYRFDAIDDSDKWKRMALMSKSNARRAIIVLGGFALLIALFYAEEDWRGWRAWKNCKRELEAKGAVLDWDKFIPAPVPDDQNFFAAPKMAEWFVKNRNASTNELTARLRKAETTAKITDETAARKYLAWSDQFEPDFDLIREALKRPYARMDGDYSIPYEIPIPNFVAVRIVAQTLAQRTKCDLLLGRPDRALQELTLLHDMCRLLEAAPTGKPMTLVSAMINVAVTGLYADTIASGLQSHAWQEPQLAALQKQLKEISLPPFVIEGFHLERASAAYLETWLRSNETLWQKIKNLRIPHGWFYQNLVIIAELDQKATESWDLVQGVVLPHKLDDLQREQEAIEHHYGPYTFYAAMALPNYARASLTLARNQTLVNEAQIACALERCRLAYGGYPPTLDALVPQFIEKLPHDIIGGQPLIYRRTGDGKFLLYSIGWNETDDGGVASDKMDQGDWVWGVTR
jgi:hypothetical protein